MIFGDARCDQISMVDLERWWNGMTEKSDGRCGAGVKFQLRRSAAHGGKPPWWKVICGGSRCAFCLR